QSVAADDATVRGIVVAAHRLTRRKMRYWARSEDMTRCPDVASWPSDVRFVRGWRTSCLPGWLGEADQKHERCQGQQQAHDARPAEALAEGPYADGGQEADHRHRVEHADRPELQVLHHEEPAESRRRVDDEPDVERRAAKRPLLRARDLQEVVAEHAD